MSSGKDARTFSQLSRNWHLHVLRGTWFLQYPYNRKGVCNVNITVYHVNQCNIMEFIENIPFDTTKKPEDIFSLQESKRYFQNRKQQTP